MLDNLSTYGDLNNSGIDNSLLDFTIREIYLSDSQPRSFNTITTISNLSNFTLPKNLAKVLL